MAIRAVLTILAPLVWTPVSSAQTIGPPHTACTPGNCPGHWEACLQWEIQTCSGIPPFPATEYPPGHPCASTNCNPGFWGEIPHAVLFLKNAAADPPEWRVLLVNNVKSDLFDQRWWVWDAAAPGDPLEGTPLDDVLFCAGHTVLKDGRVLFAGGQQWPANPHSGDCPPNGPSWAWVFEPESNTLGKWTKLADMQKGRYYPSPVELDDGLVAVMSGDSLPLTFEVFDPDTDTWEPNLYPYSTAAGCPMVYPRPAFLPPPSPNPSGHRGAIFVSSPYSQLVPPNCSVAVPTQLLPVPSTGFGSPLSPAWQAGPNPVETSRADNGSVIVVDDRPAATGGLPEVRIFMGTGRDTPFGGTEKDSAEWIQDPQSGGAAWQAFPHDLTFARFHASFVLLPGRKLLILGGKPSSPVAPQVHTPEWIDLDDLAAGWTSLADHQQYREYHSFAVLLPDGRVLHGGGQIREDAEYPDGYCHGEVFNPPNVFGRRPRFADRSVIDGTYQQQLTVMMGLVPPSGIASFELLRPGSFTHSTDFDQRLVVLPFEPVVGTDDFIVTLPSAASVAPPGWYMLFAVAGDGTASSARFVHVE